MTLHKTILLTGSTGLVGQAIAKLLMQRDIKFIATNNQHEQNFEWPTIKVDLQNDKLQKKFAGYLFEADRKSVV